MPPKHTYKRRATPEQIEAARARDAETSAAADLALTEPDVVTEIVNWISNATGSVRRFSLRNQALLFNQAKTRGGPLPTDVRTFNQWKKVGRIARKGTAYYLTVPKGQEAVEGQGNDQPSDNGDAGGSEENATRTRFRTFRFFDIADTDGADDLDAVELTSAESIDPLTAVRDRLAEQIAERDYSIDWDADVHGVNHDNRTVSIARADSHVRNAALGVQLAAIITHLRITRINPTPFAPEDLPAGVERIRLELDGDYGTATVDVSTNWDNGRTLYHIKARQVKGAITVLPEQHTYDHAVRPAGVDVRIGDNTTDNWPSEEKLRVHALHVNGIELTGGIRGLTFETVSSREGYRNQPWSTQASRYVGLSRYQSAPAATSDRYSAVLRAVLLQHWFARSDLAEVREVAARVAAPKRQADQQGKADYLAKQIADLEEQRRVHETQAAEFTPLIDSAEDVAHETGEPVDGDDLVLF